MFLIFLGLPSDPINISSNFAMLKRNLFANNQLFILDKSILAILTIYQ